jgi:hypothetical protein
MNKKGLNGDYHEILIWLILLKQHDTVKRHLHFRGRTGYKTSNCCVKMSFQNCVIQLLSECFIFNLV